MDFIDFFSNRVVKMWNILPNTIKQINCRNRFVKPFKKLLYNFYIVKLTTTYDMTTLARGLPFVAVRDVARHETLFSLFLLDTSQQAREVHLVLSRCWASVVDDGPALIRRLMGVSCFAGMRFS